MQHTRQTRFSETFGCGKHTYLVRCSLVSGQWEGRPNTDRGEKQRTKYSARPKPTQNLARYRQKSTTSSRQLQKHLEQSRVGRVMRIVFLREKCPLNFASKVWGGLYKHWPAYDHQCEWLPSLHTVQHQYGCVPTNLECFFPFALDVGEFYRKLHLPGSERTNLCLGYTKLYHQVRVVLGDPAFP